MKKCSKFLRQHVEPGHYSRAPVLKGGNDCNKCQSEWQRKFWRTRPTRCWNEDIKSRIIFHTHATHTVLTAGVKTSLFCALALFSVCGSGEKEKKNLFWKAGPIDLMAFADDGALKNHLRPSMSIIGQLIPPQHIIYIEKGVGMLFLRVLPHASLPVATLCAYFDECIFTALSFNSSDKTFRYILTTKHQFVLILWGC